MSDAPSEDRDIGLEKLVWLLGTQQRQRALSAAARAIPRRETITAEEFLDEFYAPARPVIVTGMTQGWPARDWTPAALRAKVGPAMVEYQGGRSRGAQYERFKDDHKRDIPFDRFIDLIAAGSGNDAYITAYNSGSNGAALRALHDDLGPLDAFLDGTPAAGMMWIGPSGTFTPLHHDLTNNLFVQVVGRKRVAMVPAAELPKLYNDHHVFSMIGDIADPAIDFELFPLLREIDWQEIVLKPGEILFIPIGWWHQIEALDFSVSLTFTNFRWRNDFYADYPGGD